jgi:hypothetical protein
VGAFNGLAISIWIAMCASAGLYDARRLINAADEFKLIRAATCAMWSRAPVGSASRSSDSSTTTVRAARLPPACPR